MKDKKQLPLEQKEKAVLRTNFSIKEISYYVAGTVSHCYATLA